MALNEYDELLEEQQQVAAPNPDPYESLIDDERNRAAGQIRDSLSSSKGTTPDTRAEALKLGDRFRLPHDVVERNLDYYRSRALETESDYMQMLDRSPKLADWIARQPETAGAAKDDLRHLGQLENSLTFGAAILRGVDQAQSMLGDFLGATGELVGSERLATYGTDMGRSNRLQSAALGKSTTISSIESPWDLAQWMKETVGTQIPIMGPMMAGGATGAAIGSVVPVVGTTVGGIIGAFLPAFAFGVGEVQGAIKEADPNAKAPMTAFIGGSAIAAFDSVLPGHVGSRLVRLFGRETAEEVAKRALMAPVKPAFLRTTVGETAHGIATEGLTEALQEAIGAVAASQGSQTPMDWRQTWSQMLEAGAAGALVGGVSSGAGVALTHNTEMARFTAAQQQKLFFDSLAAGATDSKLAQRLPEAFQKFVAHATKDGPVEHVYIDTQAFIDYWTKKDVSPEAVARELTGSDTALGDAIDAGTKLRMDTAAYAAKLAATEHHGFFSNELSLDPNLLSPREAQEAQEALEAQADSIAQAVEGAQAEAPDAVVSPLRAQVRSMLEADPAFQQMAGREGVEAGDAANSYAAGIEAVFTGLGQRLGQDPQALFSRYGLQFGLGAAAQAVQATNASREGVSPAREAATPPAAPGAGFQPAPGSGMSRDTADALRASGIEVTDDQVYRGEERRVVGVDLDYDGPERRVPEGAYTTEAQRAQMLDLARDPAVREGARQMMSRLATINAGRESHPRETAATRALEQAKRKEPKPKPAQHPHLALAPAIVQMGMVTLSTRVPTAVEAQPSSAPLFTNLEALRLAPEAFDKIAQKLKESGLVPESVAKQNDNEAILASFIESAKRNLKFLYDLMTPENRQRAKLWYVGAHRIAQQMATDYNLTKEQAAAVLACLSPQMDWFKNVSLARRAAAIFQKAQVENPEFDKKLIDHYINRAKASHKAWMRGLVNKELKKVGSSNKLYKDLIKSGKKPPKAVRDAKARGEAMALAYQESKLAELRSDRKAYQGKRWHELADDGKARLLRAIDETTNSTDYPVILPEGEDGALQRNKAGKDGKLGKPSKVAWGSYAFIENTISVMRDGSIGNISQRVGGEHKVRSFFNNIANPWDPNSVTIDTHAVAAAHLEPMAGSDPAVKYTMSGPGNADTGISGSNAVYAEAYNQLAAELGLAPRELQSITWEAVRALFTPEQKRSGLPKLVKGLWKQFRDGKITEEALHGSVLGAAKNLGPLAWADTPPRLAYDEGRLRAGDVQPVGPSVSAGRGDRGGGAGSPTRRDANLPDGLVVPDAGPEELRTLNQGARGSALLDQVRRKLKKDYPVLVDAYVAQGGIDPRFQRARELYLERGGGHHGVRMAQALKDAGYKFPPERTVAQRLAGHAFVNARVLEAHAPAGPTEGPFAQPAQPHTADAFFDWIRQTAMQEGDLQAAAQVAVQVLPPAPIGGSMVAELEAMATDEAMDVRFEEDGSFIGDPKDDIRAVNCTNCARKIIDMVGRGEVYGWEEGTNPTSVVAGPTKGAQLDDGQGHDFAIIDDRYLVDPWAKNVEVSSPRAAFDLYDPADRAEVLRLYGDPDTWLREKKEGRGFEPGKPTPLQDEWRTLNQPMLRTPQDFRDAVASNVELFENVLEAYAEDQLGEGADLRIDDDGYIYDADVVHDRWDVDRIWKFIEWVRGPYSKQAIGDWDVWNDIIELTDAFTKQNLLPSTTPANAKAPTFYSRLIKTVEESTQGKASGAQWKALLRNKTGVKADDPGGSEYGYANVQDLKDDQAYTKGEVLEYLRLNTLQLEWVSLSKEDSEPITDEQVTERADRIYERMIDAQVDRFDQVNPDNELEITTGQNADGTWWSKVGDDTVGESFDTRDEAFDVAYSEQDLRYENEREQQREDAKEEVSWDDALAEAERELENEAGPRELFDNFVVNGPIEEDSYREVILRAPSRGMNGLAGLTAKENALVPDAFKQFMVFKPDLNAPRRNIGVTFQPMTDEPRTEPAPRAEVLKWVRAAMEDARDRQVSSALDQTRKHYKQLGDIYEKIMGLDDLTWRQHNWRDGHEAYDHIANPLVRLRYTIRRNEAGEKILFLEEVQPPQKDEFKTMPRLFRDNWRELAMKWAMAHAAELDADIVAWSTGTEQARRWQLAKHVSSVDVMPVLADLPNGGQEVKFHVKAKDLGNRTVFDSDQYGVLSMKEMAQTFGEGFAEKVRQGASTNTRQKVWVDEYERMLPLLGGDEVAAGKLADDALEAADKARGYAMDDPAGVVLQFRGQDLEVGGDGLKRLYDVDLPRVVQKLPAVKKAGLKAGMFPIITRQDDKPFTGNASDNEAVRAWQADPANVVNQTTEMPGIRLTPEVKEKFTEAQPLFQDERGQIVFNRARTKFKITLSPSADLSTVLHELGHFYLEVLGDLTAGAHNAADPSTMPGMAGLKQDYDTILKFIGADPGQEITTEQHEKFARAFETYLLEGKAPTAGLQGAFARFRSWLVALYRTPEALEAELSDEVRQVFDRLVSADQAAKNAASEGTVEPFFATAEEMGVSDYEFQAYKKTAQEAHDAATTNLQNKLMRELQRERTAWWKAKRDEVRAQVEQQVWNDKTYMALIGLQQGRHPSGAPLPQGMENLKIDRASIIAKLGKERLATLPKPWVYAVEGGADVDLVAEMFGFSSGDELVRALAGAGKMNKVIAEQTNARMKELYGDMRQDGALRQEAQAAVQDRRGDVLTMELRALVKKAREVAPHVRASKRQEAVEQKSARKAAREALNVAPIDQVRQIAEARIAKMTPRQIKPHEFWTAAKQAGDKAMAAAMAGNLEQAVAEKQKQRLAVELYNAANAALTEADKIRVYMGRFDDKGPRAVLGKAGDSYIDQVDAIREKFEFKRVTGKTLRQRSTLLAWIQARTEEGYDTSGIPAEVIEAAQQVNFTNVSIERLREVRDTVQQIASLARLKTRLLADKKNRQFSKARDQIVQGIEANSKGNTLPVEHRRKEQRALDIASWFATHARISRLAEMLDGWKSNGPMWDYIIRPLNLAADTEAQRRRDEGKKFQAIINKHYPGADLAGWSAVQFIPAIGTSLSKEGRLALALNWGNATSRDRAVNQPGRRWNEAQVRSILETLDNRDWLFVQDVWDYLDTYWQEISDKQQRVTGLRPEKVEAVPVNTRFGTFRGGYYPLAYDSRRTARGQEIVSANEAKGLMQAAFVRQTTARGHIEARQQHVELDLRLDLGVAFAHLDRVIHDLTHHETLIDVTRLIRDKGVSQAIINSAGPQVLEQFKSAMTDIATGGKAGMNPMDRAATFLRVGTQVAAMGFSFWTAIQQPLGIFNGAAEVGPRWVAKGMSRWLRDAATMENTAAWIRERSPMMRNRSITATQDLNDVRASLQEPGGWFDQLIRKVSNDKFTQQNLADAYLWHIGLAQQVADIPTWLGAYEKAMATQGGDEELSARLADQAVLNAQGGGQIKDLAQVQRGGPVAKLFMVFFSYGITMHNATAKAWGKAEITSPAKMAKFIGTMSLLYLFPAFGTVTLRHLFGKDDDDEWLEDVGREMLSTAMNTMVFVREASILVQDEARGYAGPAGARAFDLIIRAGNQIKQGEADEALWHTLNAAAGVLFKYPATQLQRTVDGWIALMEGRTTNPGALLVGPPPKE